MNYCSTILYLLLLVACQSKPSTIRNSSTGQLVHVKSVAPLEQAADGKYEVPVVFEIASGYHIMADTGRDESWVYTRMSLLPQKGYLTGTPLFPVPKAFYFQENTEPLSVFAGDMLVKIPIYSSVQAGAGAYTLRGHLFYQACTDQKCFFPRKLDFEIPVRNKG